MRPIFLHQLLGVVFACLCSASNAQSEPQPTLPTRTLSVGLYLIQAEVAATPEQRQTGLMLRKNLGTNAGMLFIFDENEKHCMWMHNTLVPLSVAFIADDGRIINIENMSPRSEKTHCAKQPARYALEMNQGWFARRGIQPGSVLKNLRPSS